MGSIKSIYTRTKVLASNNIVRSYQIAVALIIFLIVDESTVELQGIVILCAFHSESHQESESAVIEKTHQSPAPRVAAGLLRARGRTAGVQCTGLPAR